MKEWLILSAIIAGAVGFVRGMALYGMSDAILALQGTVVAVLILLCAPPMLLSRNRNVETQARRFGLRHLGGNIWNHWSRPWDCR